MPLPPPSRPTASPAGAQARALGFALLAAVVALLHGALLESPVGALGPHRRQPAEAAQAVRMVLAPTPQAPRAATAEEVVAPPGAAPPVAAVPAAPLVEVQPAVQRSALAAPAPEGRRAPTAAPAAETPLPPPPPAAPDDPAPATPTPTAEAEPPPAAASTLVAEAASAQPGDPTRATAPTAERAPAAAVTPAAGGPPPVYPTEPPMPRTLDYRVVRGAATGVGQLRWEPTPAGYSLSLQASTPQGPALDWISRGAFDHAGLAPQRMVERQRQRDVHAVNFQRDKQLISFSGPARVAPLLRGAQDRLSWLIQLTAVAQARRADLKDGDTLRFQVASPRGDVDEWVFTVEGTVPVEAAGQRWGALKLVREPQRPYDQRVEVWLAPTASYLPLGLTLTTVPGGEALELWLTGGIRLEL